MTDSIRDAACEFVNAWVSEWVASDGAEWLLVALPVETRERFLELLVACDYAGTAENVRARFAERTERLKNYVVIDAHNRVQEAFEEGNDAIAWRQKHEPSRFAWSVVTSGQAEKAGLL